MLAVRRIGKVEDAPGCKLSNLGGRAAIDRLAPDIRHSVIESNVVDRASVRCPLQILVIGQWISLRHRRKSLNYVAAVERNALEVSAWLLAL